MAQRRGRTPSALGGAGPPVQSSGAPPPSAQLLGAPGARPDGLAKKQSVRVLGARLQAIKGKKQERKARKEQAELHARVALASAGELVGGAGGGSSHGGDGGGGGGGLLGNGFGSTASFSMVPEEERAIQLKEQLQGVNAFYEQWQSCIDSQLRLMEQGLYHTKILGELLADESGKFPDVPVRAATPGADGDGDGGGDGDGDGDGDDSGGGDSGGAVPGNFGGGSAVPGWLGKLAGFTVMHVESMVSMIQKQRDIVSSDLHRFRSDVLAPAIGSSESYAQTLSKLQAAEAQVNRLRAMKTVDYEALVEAERARDELRARSEAEVKWTIEQQESTVEATAVNTLRNISYYLQLYHHYFEMNRAALTDVLPDIAELQGYVQAREASIERKRSERELLHANGGAAGPAKLAEAAAAAAQQPKGWINANVSSINTYREERLARMGVPTVYSFECARWLKTRKKGLRKATARGVLTINLVKRDLYFRVHSRKELDKMKEHAVGEGGELLNHDTFTYNLATLLKARRSDRSNMKLKLFWPKEGEPHRYLFGSPEDREHFLEALWMDMHGFDTDGDSEEISVFIGTFNCGDGALPADLSPWIDTAATHDVYAVGAQECEYEPTPPHESCEADFFGRIQATLGPEYVKIAGLSLQSIRMVVFAKRHHYYKINNIRKSSEATGIGNVYGNKGAVGVSFAFHETKMAFVCAHLAAHLENTEDRNTDYRNIVRSLALSSTREKFDLCNAFHHTFFFGDLNYRIHMQRDKVIEAIDRQDWRALYGHDQLAQQKNLGKTFFNFREAPIGFAPTYRLKRGTLRYDEAKGRIPAWCDRVLVHSLPSCEAEQLTYGRCEAVRSSDHLPVHAAFRVSTALMNPPHIPTKMRIVVTELRLTAPHAPQGACCVQFHGPYLNKHAQTASLPRGSDLRWRAEEIPVLQPFITNRPYYAHQHLWIKVKEAGESFAQCVVPLRNATGVRSVYFETKVTHNGIFRGLLAGRVHCAWAREERSIPAPQLSAQIIEEHSLSQGGDEMAALLGGGPVGAVSAVDPVGASKRNSLPAKRSPKIAQRKMAASRATQMPATAAAGTWSARRGGGGGSGVGVGARRPIKGAFITAGYRSKPASGDTSDAGSAAESVVSSEVGSDAEGGDSDAAERQLHALALSPRAKEGAGGTSTFPDHSAASLAYESSDDEADMETLKLHSVMTLVEEKATEDAIRRSAPRSSSPASGEGSGTSSLSGSGTMRGGTSRWGTRGEGSRRAGLRASPDAIARALGAGAAVVPDVVVPDSSSSSSSSPPPPPSIATGGAPLAVGTASDATSSVGTAATTTTTESASATAATTATAANAAGTSDVDVRVRTPTLRHSYGDEESMA